MLNKCILMGRLTKDPVLRHTQNNTPVTTFTLAIDRSFKAEQKQTDFIDIVCWEKLAEFTANYFGKGRQVAVVGRLQQRQWEDKDGNKRTSYEVVANEAHFADSKPNNDGQNPYAQSAPRNDYNQAPPRASATPTPAVDSTGFTELMDDDGQLPF